MLCGEIMKVKILKGTNQIGGVFTEIKTQEGRILIDFRPRFR